MWVVPGIRHIAVLGKLYAAARVAAILKLYGQLTGETPGVPIAGESCAIEGIQELGDMPVVESAM